MSNKCPTPHGTSPCAHEHPKTITHKRTTTMDHHDSVGLVNGSQGFWLFPNWD